MKSPRLLGQVLAVCLPVLFFGMTAAPGPFVAPTSATSYEERLSFYHKEDTLILLSVVHPSVTQVRLSVQNGYANAASGATTYQILHDALTTDFGAQIVETQEPVGYRLEWDPELEEWVLVCTVRLRFVVDFGVQGHVVVEVDQRTITR